MSAPTRPEPLTSENSLDRRRLLAGGAVATAMAAALAACGSSSSSTATSSATSASPSPTGPTDTDLAVATLAAGLEVLAVQTYTAALAAATAGKVGSVPAVVATYATTAKTQHQAHLDAWNGILKASGKSEVTEPNAALKTTVDGLFAKVTDVAGVANLALTLEQIAAQTYLKALPTLTSKAAIQKAGEIIVIDQQHQAILHYALGQYPVPEGFLGTDKGVTS